MIMGEILAHLVSVTPQNRRDTIPQSVHGLGKFSDATRSKNSGTASRLRRCTHSGGCVDCNRIRGYTGAEFAIREFASGDGAH